MLENLSIQEVYDKYFDKVMTTTNAQTSIRQEFGKQQITRIICTLLRILRRVEETKGNERNLFSGSKKSYLFG